MTTSQKVTERAENIIGARSERERSSERRMPKPRPVCVEKSIQKEFVMRMRMARHVDFTSISDIRAVILFGSKPVGLFQGQVVHFSECPGDGLFDEMDGHSQDLLDCYCDLFGNGQDFTEFEDVAFGDLLNLHAIEIAEAFRGRGLGNQILAAVLSFFAKDCDFAIMKPFPLQWSGWLGDAATPAQRAAFEEQQLKLIRYYSPLGFRRIPGTKERYIRRLQAGEVILGQDRREWKRARSVSLPSVDRFEPRGLNHSPKVEDPHFES